MTPSLPAPGRLHVHRFRFTPHESFSAHSLYACRCGVVRPAL